MKILVVEDDIKINEILKKYLEHEGYTVTSVFNGDDALSYFDKDTADLILLDWMLPKQSGIEVCKAIRTMDIPTKIIMLTAKDTPESELLGLTSGADDYIRKPFDIQIVLLRIKKLLNIEKTLRYKDISLNTQTGEVYRNKMLLTLTLREYKLLEYLMMNQNVILTRNQIISNVWGIDYDGEMRTIDTHIRRLRVKIGDDTIKTKVGLGYVMGVLYE